MSSEFYYRGWRIKYNPKPIPDRKHDYDATHEEYDGTNGLHFTSGSKADCIAQIDSEYGD